MLRDAIGGKTGKTVVLPGFCKIERGSSSSAPLCYRDLIWLGGACCAGGAPSAASKWACHQHQNVNEGPAFFFVSVTSWNMGLIHALPNSTVWNMALLRGNRR